MDLSALAPATTSATALANLVLVSPQSVVGYQPQPNSSIVGPVLPPPAILFHYEGEQTVMLESDITDHYVEDNTAVQDQIAIKPEIITTHGYIGELNNVPPSFLKPLKFIADKLYVINAYTPQLTTTALIAYQQAFFLYQVAANVVDSAVSAWNTLTGQGDLSVINEQGLNVESNQNKQQTAFQQFYGYWRSRTLFTVQTPWAIFQNMAIMRLRAIQDAETRVITDFEVTFKMIRKATSILGPSPVLQGQAATQAASATDMGTNTPSASISLAEGIAGMG